MIFQWVTLIIKKEKKISGTNLVTASSVPPKQNNTILRGTMDTIGNTDSGRNPEVYMILHRLVQQMQHMSY